MKKILEKHGMLNCVGALLDIISVVLFIVAAFVEEANPDMILKIVGVVFFLIGSMIMALNSDDHRLVKSLMVFVFTAGLLTWLFPYGYFQGADFYENAIKRVGLNDVGFAFYHSINFIMDKIIFLLVVAGFYGVLSKVDGYQKLVEKIANGLKKNNIITYISTVVISLIIFVLTSLFTQTFIVVLFIPFFISVLLKMGMDKLTTFAVTFGSALVGILGCTYGTDSLGAFSHYLSKTVTFAINYRFIIAVITFILYAFFLIMRVNKVLKGKKKTTKASMVDDDPFKVETTKTKTNIIPIIVILVLLAVIVILGYVDWKANFGIKAFDDLHTWLTGLKIGDDFTIISYILGNEAKPFGQFPFVFSLTALLLIVTGLIAFLYRVKINEFIEAFYEGMKKVYKPILFLLGVYLIFGISNITPVAPTLVNWVSNLVKGFNPYLTAINAFITSVFQIDFGYVAYTIGGLITTTYATTMELAYTIFTSIYGLVQVFMPTSALLVVGLAMMKIDYKDWLKYIWLFVVGMLVILLVFFTVVTYIL